MKDSASHIESYLRKSARAIREAELLYTNEFYEAAVTRLYYACFYAVHALLVKHDIRTKSHSGAKQMFGLHFIKPGIIPNELGELYSSLLNNRQLIDYADGADYTKEMLEEMIPKAKELIQLINELIQIK